MILGLEVGGEVILLQGEPGDDRSHGDPGLAQQRPYPQGWLCPFTDTPHTLVCLTAHPTPWQPSQEPLGRAQPYTWVCSLQLGREQRSF